ncbi:MAG: C25 family cysteine peptidase [Candidatus Krumholzibacteria bacterium]|nr:C25 family cysteine peptidase [Candidatus Krumholzibacteria bacterium]
MNNRRTNRLSSKGIFAMAAALAAAILPASAMAAAPEARLIGSGRSSLTFEIALPEPEIASGEDGARVTLPGYGTFSPAGAPELPGRVYNIAVPSAGAVRVTWSIASSSDLGVLELRRVPGERFVGYGDGIPVTETFLPPDPWGGEIPVETVTAGEPAMMGRQRVVPVRVCPLSREGGRYILARRIVITVSFEGAAPADARLDAPAPSPVWKGLYERTLVNPGDVERFSAGLRRPAALRGPAQEGARLRIRIPDTGLYSVRADSLIAAGFSVGQAEYQFALRKLYFDQSEPDLEREVDVPYRIVKGSASSPGIFGGDDRIVFYARGVKDDAAAGDTVATYNTYNILWLIEDEAGTMIPDAPPMPTGDAVAPQPFVHTERIRRDTYYYKYLKAGGKDFYYVLGPKLEEAVVAFPVHDQAPLTGASLHVRIRGDVKLNPSQDLEFFIRNGGGTTRIGGGFVSATSEAVFNFTGLGPGIFAEGDNALVVTSEEEYGFLVNDMTVRYTREFAAHDDLLEFTLAPAMIARDVEITGFSAPGGYLVEITDPDRPLFLPVPPDSFGNEGGSWTMRVKLDGESARRFVAGGAAAGRHVYNAWVTPDAPSDIRGRTGPYHAIVISHADFLPPASTSLEQYRAWREAQGYRLLVVDARDVYDEFNGGLIHADAIRRLARYGVERWGVEFLLLVGDSSEDHRRVFIGDPPETRGSPPDYVPAYTYSVSVIGRLNDEAAASDKYYVFLDEPAATGLGAPAAPAPGGGPSYALPAAAYPDLIVGRMSVGRDLELRALLTKMYRYEEPAAGEDWRRRIVVFADDAWSGSRADYSYKSIERYFEYGMDSVAVKMDRALPGGFEIWRLFLDRWTDGVHDTPDGGSLVLSEATDSTRRYFTPYLVRRLNDGCLFYSFQGHAARSNLTTESAFSIFNQYKDLDSLRTDRNHVFFGFGCHISDFALMQELSRAGFEGGQGDCLAEQLLIKSRSGAVGTYASSAFEYLLENQDLCTTLHETIFGSPPVDSVPPLKEYTGARWILGEAVTAGEIEHLARASYSYEQIYRYITLGDPMLRIDPGPPLMKLEADWGSGWEQIVSDTLRSRRPSNACRLRFTASDVVALGGLTLEIDGEDRTGDLTVAPLRDEGLTYARAYAAELGYTVEPGEHVLSFVVLSPGGGGIGAKEVRSATGLRLFHGSLEIEPGGDAPASGEFRLDIRLPVWLSAPPALLLDGIEIAGAQATAPDPSDSTHWEARFAATLAAGEHVVTARIDGYDADFPFIVGGTGLVMEAFNIPNPFADGTNILYSLNLPADGGRIMIFNVSGIMIREILLTRDLLGAAPPGAPNAVWWDGRDFAGDAVANGTYLYVIEIEKDGGGASAAGKAVRLR